MLLQTKNKGRQNIPNEQKNKEIQFEKTVVKEFKNGRRCHGLPPRLLNVSSQTRGDVQEARCRLWDPKVLHSKPGSPKRSSVYVNLAHVQSNVLGQTPSRWCGAKFGERGADSDIVLVI
ncbi:hypothetical protein AVEN_371-1 [Araneus ventricosus]|uniref:Uncharacterized protein n=1 Tax=Araneus ventricosus TaxID=182803 RepID=A0A4Y2DS46_ARAVE|nr:hypothetical protein AVEN_371-1 [Araneus ventricosus]